MSKKELESLIDVELALNELQEKEAEMAEAVADANTKIAKIRAAVTPAITSLEETTIRLRNQIITWAENNREDESLFPPGRKTLDLRSAIISFRTGAQSVSIKKGWDDSDVIEAIKELGIKNVLKTPDPTLDKTALKKAYNQGKIGDGDLKKIGVEITQSESINIDLKTVDKYSTAA